MKATSRCGLGQTSFNPVLTSLASFRPLYESLVQEHPQKFRRSFDLERASVEGARIRAGGGR
jgi:[NiFe] hydrogenase diaphorase moiety large subunit